MSEKQIDERRLHLEEYLQQIVAQLNWSLDDSLRSFLECDEWLKPRKSKAKKTKKEVGAGVRAAAGPVSSLQACVCASAPLTL